MVIDYYSKYIEAITLNGKTSSDIIGCLNEIFSRHGYPQTLIAENMPYNSREMKEYATQYGIHIITTSPTYSQANGLAVKAVHIVKNLLRKECNLNEGLMEYRKTPISNFPYSPNQMLFSRQIRTRVPVHPLVLVPQICHDVPEFLGKRQAKYKEFCDRQGSKQLPQLKEGDSVRFKKPGDKHLSHAIVTGKHDTPRSYMITGLPVWQSQSESGWDLFVLFILLILFSVSVKVLPVTPLVSGVFVHRAFCAYFLRIERVVEMRRCLWWTQEND